MRIFKHKSFHQWAISENMADNQLKKAIKEIEKGLFEACLGSGLYKKRVAIIGKGKSGGYRTLVAFKNNHRAFFIYGFAKNVRANINEKEEKIYRQLAKNLLQMNEKQLKKLLEENKLIEVK